MDFLTELNQNELVQIDGGDFVILRWTGWGDGIKGNTDIDFLWWDIV